LLGRAGHSSLAKSHLARFVALRAAPPPSRSCAVRDVFETIEPAAPEAIDWIRVRRARCPNVACFHSDPADRCAFDGDPADHLAM
jgi:hypothetical protein